MKLKMTNFLKIITITILILILGLLALGIVLNLKSQNGGSGNTNRPDSYAEIIGDDIASYPTSYGNSKNKDLVKLDDLQLKNVGTLKVTKLKRFADDPCLKSQGIETLVDISYYEYDNQNGNPAQSLTTGKLEIYNDLASYKDRNKILKEVYENFELLKENKIDSSDDVSPKRTILNCFFGIKNSVLVSVEETNFKGFEKAYLLGFIGGGDSGIAKPDELSLSFQLYLVSKDDYAIGTIYSQYKFFSQNELLATCATLNKDGTKTVKFDSPEAVKCLKKNFKNDFSNQSFTNIIKDFVKVFEISS